MCYLRNSTSCMFIYRCDSIVFYMLSLMYRYWLLFTHLSLSLLHQVSYLASYRIVLSLLSLGHVCNKLPIPQQEADSSSDELLSDQGFYITHCILIVSGTSHKRCYKSCIALFLSNTHLRRFYSLVIHCHYPLPVSINWQFFHKSIGPP